MSTPNIYPEKLQNLEKLDIHYISDALEFLLQDVDVLARHDSFMRKRLVHTPVVLLLSVVRELYSFSFLSSFNFEI